MEPDNYYPTVDIDFLIERAKQSPMLAENGIIKFGNTYTFVSNGKQAIYKRSVLVRQIEPGKVCLELSTALAMKYHFLGDLLKWLEKEKNWKEGAYIVAKETANADVQQS